MPPLFFQWNFGVWNLSVRPSEAAESLSAVRALDLAIDPNLGLLPHAPVTLALGIGVALAAHAPTAAVTRVWSARAAAAPAIACTANSNWNNDTAGPSRYVVWMFPLLAFAAAGGGAAPERPAGTSGRVGARTGARHAGRAARGARRPARAFGLPPPLAGGALRARPLAAASIAPSPRCSWSARSGTRGRSRDPSSTATPAAAVERPGCSPATPRSSRSCAERCRQPRPPGSRSCGPSRTRSATGCTSPSRAPVRARPLARILLAAARRPSDGRDGCSARFWCTWTDAQALGIQPPILLGFPDGKLGDYVGDRALIYRVTQRIAEELGRLRPDAVITWGPDGGTGHPDHRIVSNIVTQLQRAGAPGVPERVFYMNLPVESMRAMNPQRGEPPLTVPQAKYFTVRVPFAPEDLRAVERAMACHRLPSVSVAQRACYHRRAPASSAAGRSPRPSCATRRREVAELEAADRDAHELDDVVADGARTSGAPGGSCPR